MLHQSTGGRLVVGIDEVGRGAWAGPVVVGAARGSSAAAAAVLWHPRGGVRDSKALSPAGREAALVALEAAGLELTVGSASAREIDELGLTGALRLAAQRALGEAGDLEVLLDGRVPYVEAGRVHCVVGGDRRHPLIAAASIVAKVRRDAFMVELDGVAAGYGFARHKGYGTAEHRRALSEHGVTPWHRRSFGPIGSMLGRA